MSLLPLLASLLVCIPAFALAQPSAVVTEHVRAELVAHAPDGVVPGKAMWLGLAIQHQPHWHSYWKNPGDSGLPTSLSWQLSEGVQVGAIQWPTPKQLPVGSLMNYGYEDQLLLPVAVTVPAGFSARSLEVKLRADWLVCKDICIPESGEFSLRVPAQASTVAHASLFATSRARLPVLVDEAHAIARVEGQTLAVEVSGLPPASHPQQQLKFFAETAGVIDHAARIEQRWEGARWVARIPLSAQRSESPSIMYAVLTAPEQPAGMRVRLSIEGPWLDPAITPVPSAPATLPAAPPITTSFMFALGLALLGGILLNLMPCVFPVLSLKVLALAQPGQHRRTLAVGGLAYTTGVIVSFVALAGLLQVLRSGGEQLGWGFQLQSPAFVAVLAIVFTLIGLNLAGVFEFGLVVPGKLATLRARHPTADHALTGVLAVAVASPCTGPFMGVALGAALTLPAVQALTVFAALGLGMALPYLAVSFLPGLARRLPRPGAWMVRFKAFLAFPMFATVAWLVWVLKQQVGFDGAAGLLAVLVALALATWAIGSRSLGRKERFGFGAAALLALVAAPILAWPVLRSSPIVTREAPAAARWQSWSRAAVATAQAEGRPVFVDFTAAWCVTCQLNKRTTLADPSILAEFDRRRVLLLRADWTRRDAEITGELTRLGRSGVPAYALYAPSAQTPSMLPEILRVGDLRRALEDLPPAITDEPTSMNPTRRE